MTTTAWNTYYNNTLETLTRALVMVKWNEDQLNKLMAPKIEEAKQSLGLKTGGFTDVEEWLDDNYGLEGNDPSFYDSYYTFSIGRQLQLERENVRVDHIIDGYLSAQSVFAPEKRIPSQANELLIYQEANQIAEIMLETRGMTYEDALARYQEFQKRLEEKAEHAF